MGMRVSWMIAGLPWEPRDEGATLRRFGARVTLRLLAAPQGKREESPDTTSRVAEPVERRARHERGVPLGSFAVPQGKGQRAW